MHNFHIHFRRVVAIAGVVFLPLAILITVRLHTHGGFEFEKPLMMWVHHNIGEGFFPIATVLHYLGKTAIAVPLIGIAAWWLYRVGNRRGALFCVSAALIPTLNMLLIKNWFERPRPLFWPRMIEETNFSFPSGHSTFSAAIAVMMIMLCRETPYRRVAWLIGIAFALSTGFSRVYLGVHYPTDVWAGWTNGTLTALLVYYFVFRGRYLSDDPAVSQISSDYE